MSRFLRVAEVQLGVEGDTGRALSGLRVSFDISMDDTPNPNSGRVTLYNAAPETIALAQREGAVVRLLAGYEGAPPRLLFHGNPIPDGVESRRDGHTRHLVIEAQDGRRAYTGTWIDEAFEGERTARQIYQRVADELGVPLGRFDVGEDVRFPAGLALTGPAREVLDRLSSMTDRKWMIRDGALQVWRPAATTGEPAVLFSSRTRTLIGSPVRTDEGVEVRGHIDPSVRPGRPFRVESEAIEGDYVCTECQFRGDTRGADWYVIATGRPL